MKENLKAFFKYRYLLVNLIERDFKVKYRRSVLGIVWSVLNPLLMMLVITAVFSTFFKSDIPNFPVYLLTGQLMFNFFSESTNNAMTSVLGAAPLIKKVYIPKSIFPMEKVMFSLVNTLFSLVAVVLVMLFTHSQFAFTCLLFPVPILLLAIFNLGVGLILSTMTVFFRDIIHLYGVVITALTYFTPLFYPISILPPVIRSLMVLNPMYWYVSMFRNVVYLGIMPTLNQWIACVLCAVVALALGLWVFKKKQDKFILYI